MKRVVYPGTFDPITFGHIDLAKRAYELFGKLTLAVGKNPYKEPLFTLEERIYMVTKSMEQISKDIEVMNFEGLLINFIKEIDADVIIRGLRVLSDFEYEFQMALTNRKLGPEIETIFLMPNEKYTYLNSSLIKTLGRYDAEINCFVPQLVRDKLKEKFNN